MEYDCFLKNRESHIREEIEQVRIWEKKWRDDIPAFLENWLGPFYEEERGGRSDEQMAEDLLKELREMAERGDSELFVLKKIRDNPEFGARLWALNEIERFLAYEDMIDEVGDR